MMSIYNRSVPIAGFTFLQKRFKRAMIPLLTQYNGLVICDPQQSVIAAQAMIQWLIKGNYRDIAFSSFLDQGILEPFRMHNFTIQERKTFILEIDNEEEMWKRIKPAKHRQIRKAVRSEVFVTNDEPDINAAYNLVQNTFVHHGTICPITFRMFKSIFKITDPKFYCAYETANKDKLLGFVMTNTWKDTLYYTVASADKVGLSVGVPSYLIWQIMCDCLKQGIKYIDLVGANIESIAKFKAGFSPVDKNYYHLLKSSKCIELIKAICKQF